ncbi:hypothetical protein AMK26_32245 [Streptomyces sp. CB03234]|nr:hypothetical protein AMK26_32245 [Streptomyces sp. CB03234]
MASSVFGFHVPRVCRVRGEGTAQDLIPQVTEAFHTDDDDVVTETEQLREGAFALPSVVAVAGAMIVLGEPGVVPRYRTNAPMPFTRSAPCVASRRSHRGARPASSAAPRGSTTADQPKIHSH